MSLDKLVLKKCIDTAKPSEILVLSVNRLEKNSLKIFQKEIVNFIKKDNDYVIIVVKR
jgi:hypothetical protein